MSQAALDFEPRLHARTGDRATSHQAAADAARFAGSHGDRIHEALRAQGPLTAHELEARGLGLTVVQIDRRMVDLVRAGRVVATTLTRRSPGGRPATVWSAS